MTFGFLEILVCHGFWIGIRLWRIEVPKIHEENLP